MVYITPEFAWRVEEDFALDSNEFNRNTVLLAIKKKLETKSVNLPPVVCKTLVEWTLSESFALLFHSFTAFQTKKVGY